MSDQRKGLTLRAVGLGLLIVAFIDIWATYVEMYSRASRLTMDHFPIALFAVLLALLSLNSVLRKFRLPELSRSELLVILAIGFVGAKMPVDGVAGYLLGTISSFHYFATPENQWSEYYHPYLPAWLVPQGNDAIWRHFFEGVGAERGIPWGMWALPLFWWATFIGATFWVSACIVVVLRKQWVEHERLAFPLTAVASRMLADQSAVVMAALTLLRSRLLWWRIHPIGFVTSSMINTNFLAVPFFTAWGVKSIILQTGGVRLYRRAMPLFIGLMVGYVAGVCLCSVLDMLYFPAQGHVVHTW